MSDLCRIDYWELNWEDVIVRNDRLGHGAYGQVFRGEKIRLDLSENGSCCRECKP